MRNHVKQTWKQYAYIIAGATLVALAFNMFLLPARLAAGGISGVSTIIYDLYHLEPAYTQLVINIPIFITGWIVLGRDFSWKTLLGTFWVPFTIWLTADIPYTVTNPFLASVYGGIILGIGLGTVYIGNGSTGGTAAIAQILKKFIGSSSGYAQLIVDGIVVVSSIIVFNLELTLFALMCIYITSKVIDMVQLRTASNKLILIITENETKIQTLIHDEIDRSLTKVQSIGGYTESEKTMVFCVAENKEAIHLRKLLLEEEPTSFVIFMDASEILGRGFTLDKYYGQNL